MIRIYDWFFTLPSFILNFIETFLVRLCRVGKLRLGLQDVSYKMSMFMTIVASKRDVLMINALVKNYAMIC